jgi:hypothetical protein
MPQIAVQSMDFAAPLNPTFGAAAADDSVAVAPGDRVFLYVKNGHTASVNVTIASQTASANVPGVGSVAIANRVSAVPAGAERIIGPIPQGFVNNATGLATITYSVVTSVTRAAIAAPQPA